MSKLRAKITGVSGFLPDYVLNNAGIETFVDTSEEWITTRTGILERRILKGKNKGLSAMAIPAVNELLEKTNTKPEEIQGLICASVTGDKVFPATANIICDGTNIRSAFSFDIAAACSGFLFALTTAARFVESGQCKKMIVVGGDKMSNIINYEDRTTCVIFGDGCGAVLLEATEDEYGLMDSVMYSDGMGATHLHQKAGGSDNPPSKQTVDQNIHNVYQEGKHVFKHAVTNMADAAVEIMERNNLTADDVHWLVPHQANKRIIDATANKMDLDESRIMVNIHKYGNTTNGTLALCLWDWESKLKKGDNLILAAFGGGFTWGASYIKWAY